MLTSLAVCTYEKTHHLPAVFQALAQNSWQPFEIVVVDDASKNPDVRTLLAHFQKLFQGQGVTFKVHVNPKNMGHAASQNLAWDMCSGDVLFHIEDDIVVPNPGWNLAMADFLAKHPEVGQVLPEGSGRGEWIPRESESGEYREYAWGLGGLFAIRKEVYKKVGGWDEHLRHQIEPDYNLRVRMAGWRVAEVPHVKMIHLGEGEQHDTFRRQAQIICGVHAMLMKWNKRFVGFWDYDSVWSMSWDDFPPNVAFRRQLAAYFAAQADKMRDRHRGLELLKDDPHYNNVAPDIRALYEDYRRHELNAQPEPFQFHSHWGRYELVKTIRPCGRERERELITLMKNNHAFGDVRRVEHQLRDLAKRMNYELSEAELKSIAATVPTEYTWEPRRVYGGAS